MELICVRHGQTRWNAGRRFQGHVDVPLDEQGRAQAAALGVLLRDEPLALAVSSDLSRAAETAGLVLGDRTLALRLDPRWREMRFGTWEGLTWEEIVAAQPELDGANETSPRTYTAPGGESFDELCARVADAVAQVVSELHEGERALIATHAGPLHALLRVLLRQPDDPSLRVRFATASITRFRRRAGAWELALLNQTAALAS